MRLIVVQSCNGLNRKRDAGLLVDFTVLFEFPLLNVAIASCELAHFIVVQSCNGLNRKRDTGLLVDFTVLFELPLLNVAIASCELAHLIAVHSCNGLNIGNEVQAYLLTLLFSSNFLY